MKQEIIKIDFISDSGASEFRADAQPKSLADGALVLSVQQKAASRSFGISTAVEAAVSLVTNHPTDIAIALIAHSLYDLLKHQAKSIVWRGRTYRIMEEELKSLVRALSDKIGGSK